MLPVLKSTFCQYKNIIKNSFFLTVVDGVKLLLPFIAMPYIIRVCGVENYGKIIFAQSVIAYFTIFVNFGLTIYTVREVAKNISDLRAISRLASTFITLRLLLVGVGFAVFWIMLLLFPFMQQFKLLLFYAFIAVAAEAFTMTAFFQAMEKMHNIALLQTVAVVFYISMLFLFVQSAGSYERVVLLQSAGLLIAALSGMLVLCIKHKITLFLPEADSLKEMLRGSLPFAMSRVAVIINGNVVKIFAGIALGMHELAVLDIVQKISDAATLPVDITDQAVYPHNAKKQDRKFATRTFLVIVFLGFVCAATMIICAPWAVHFFGYGKLDAAVTLLYVLAVKVVLNAMNLYAGTPVLVAFGPPEPFNMSIIYTALLTLCLYAVFYLTGLLTLKLMIAIMIFNTAFATAYRLYYCFKHKILIFGNNV